MTNFVIKMMKCLFKTMDSVFKNDEFRKDSANEEKNTVVSFMKQNDLDNMLIQVAVSIQADGFCIQDDEFCIKMMEFVFQMTVLMQTSRRCELQYKCHNIWGFSLENAEIMENFP